MKRILIIGLTERMGGVETFIYNTTIFSDKSKYQYDYLVHGADHCVYQKEINDFYNDGQQHFFFVRKLKKDPIGCIKDLKSFYKKNAWKYDAIHFESGSTAEIMYVYPFCQQYNIKVISHSHNGNGYNPIINSAFQGVVNKVSSIRLACSKEAADWLFGKKHDNDVEIINNGIDVNRFTFSENSRERIRHEYNLKNELLIGHIGRFSEQKNHSFIIDIFKEINNLVPSAKLCLVGVGENESMIHEKVSKLGLTENVIFAGQQSKTEDFYSAFDCFLMPSLYEGLPIVGIEAQCEGLPCFFSDQIDKQILITDNAHMLPLAASAKEWATKIVNSKCKNRTAYPVILDNKGYSIISTVHKLEELYGC